MSVVRAHGVGVDGVQFSAPRQDKTFHFFIKIFTPAKRAIGFED